MTTDIWITIPGFSLYEINSDGVVRHKLDCTYPELRGKLVQLHSPSEANIANGDTEEWYMLYRDNRGGPRTCGKDWLLKLTGMIND